MPVATLTLGTNNSISLPYNPNQANWTYQLNRQIMDTYGGRVVQLLSVTTNTMNMTGDAGSRKNLLKLFSDIKALQAAQISSQASAVLNIPATFAENGAITQNVYIESIDIGWDARTVTYPYKLSLQIEDSTSYGKLNDQVMGAVLAQITTALGFSDGVGLSVNGKLSLQYQGLDVSNSLTVAQLSANIWNTSQASTNNQAGVTGTGSYGV